MAKAKHRTLVRWIKRILGVAFLLAVAGMVVMAWMPKPIPVETAEATIGELVVEVVEEGRTRVKDRYVVSAPLAGTLARIELDPGDEVTEGDVVARIQPVLSPLMDASTKAQAEARVAAAKASTTQAKAQIDRAKVAQKYAEQELERTRPLAAKGAASTAELERLELDVDSRKAELASARSAARVASHDLMMAKAALRRVDGTDEGNEQLVVAAPISGRVLAVHRASEGVTQPGTPLIDIGDPRALEVVVDVLTQDAVHIERGAPARIDRWGGERLRARVRLVEPSAFTRMSSLGVEEQRVNAVLEIEDPYEQWQQLGEGYRVEAGITVWSAEMALKLPASALFRHEGGWGVFVVDNGVARRATVEVGRRSGLEAQILSGVEDGDRVIIHPSDRIEDGSEVVWR